MKKLLLLTMVMVSLFLNDYVAAGMGRNNNVSDSTKNDTLIKKEVIADPKDGFKDLFIKSVTNTGFNTARLNPMAISFVQDYMQKHHSNLTKMKDWGKPYFDI